MKQQAYAVSALVAVLSATVVAVGIAADRAVATRHSVWGPVSPVASTNHPHQVNRAPKASEPPPKQSLASRPLAEPGQLSRKASKPHQSKVSSKRVRPKAVLRPKHDILPHAILKDPRRYDLPLHYGTAGVNGPQTPYVTHDHFQELDRNQDGRIDPIERAVGRLDMDRDFPDRSR
jgi:hypothetical protein